MPDTPLPPPPWLTRATAPPVDALVSQGGALLREAHRLAVRDCAGWNTDLLAEAHEACTRWLASEEH